MKVTHPHGAERYPPRSLRFGRRLCQWSLIVVGCLYAGPCGVTSLQFRDFVTSTAIRTSVNTVTAVLEAAVSDVCTGPSGGGLVCNLIGAGN